MWYVKWARIFQINVSQVEIDIKFWKMLIEKLLDFDLKIFLQPFRVTLSYKNIKKISSRIRLWGMTCTFQKQEYKRLRHLAHLSSVLHAGVIESLITAMTAFDNLSSFYLPAVRHLLQKKRTSFQFLFTRALECAHCLLHMFSSRSLRSWQSLTPTLSHQLYIGWSVRCRRSLLIWALRPCAGFMANIIHELTAPRTSWCMNRESVRIQPLELLLGHRTDHE